MPDGVEDELVALVDEAGRVTGSAPRSVMRRDNLRHLVVAILVRDPQGRIYVHRRTDTKDIFPGMHDCFAAGCVQAGEEPAAAAAREVAEELGVVGAPLTRLFSGRYDDGATRQYFHAYQLTWSGPVVHQFDEIAWGTWMSPEELRDHLAEPDWPFVPDGRALIEHWFELGQSASSDG